MTVQPLQNYSMLKTIATDIADQIKTVFRRIFWQTMLF